MKYAVVIERASRNYSAYLPDVPGCVATGKSVAQTLANLREALEMHLADMRQAGEPIPDPETLCDYVDVDVSRLTAGDKPRLSKKSA